MPMVDTPKAGMPSGALPMLILRVLQSGSLHGYAMAQRIHVLSSEVLAVEEGLLYPTLQKMLVKGWVRPIARCASTASRRRGAST
jgi:PadR family transcriptional regulator, regulatory protein PadR